MITTERQGGVLIATLARPPVNAIDAALLAQLGAILDSAHADAGIAVLHIRSACPVFCAGADLALMRECIIGPAGADAMIEIVHEMQRLYARLEAAPFVALAEIGGAAFGGGLELALACDLRVAAHEARLALPELGLGLLPAAGGTQRLTALVGASVARRLILGGETIDGRDAERMGLVQWSHPAAELADRAAQLASRLAALPRAALVATKRCIALAEGGSDAGYAAEIDATRSLYADAQTLARVSTFLDRSRASA